ncbi:MAG TPA: dihydrolipoyl dehydrogenase [Nevskiales bacterium]|nr:dihydrolipoyl dehydrogenase [Nevskiales bacterium]
MDKTYDVVVIGGGPAGYVAAIRCAQLGMKTACIDAWLNRDGQPAFGGTCLNAGCIPSKAMLESSEVYHRARHEFARHGVLLKDLALDLAQMQKRRAEIVSGSTSGIVTLFKGYGVDGYYGRGTITAPGTVKLAPSDGKGAEQVFKAGKIIIASGSEPVELPMAKFDGERIVDSWGALEFDEVPKRLGVIGAGVIGVELGSVWSRLGAEVVILEAMDQFLWMADQQIAKEGLRQFKKQGLDIRLGCKLQSAKAGKSKVKVEYSAGDKTETLEFDKLIVAVGRRPYTRDLFAPELGIQLNERGFIAVDAHYQTSVPGIYAIGDVIGGLMLAHKGSEEGVVLAEQLAGQKAHVNYNAVPSVIYTSPEIAWVGKTEEELKKGGIEYRVGTFPFGANGRAKALEQAHGLVKIIADAKTDRILGVHMIGPYVSELIAEMVLAMEYDASSEDIARTMHAHPSLAEVVHEAALAVDGRPIHFVARRR